MAPLLCAVTLALAAADAVEERVMRREIDGGGVQATLLATARSDDDERRITMAFADAVAQARRIFAELDESVADASLARLNAANGAAVDLSPEAFEALLGAQRLARATRGLYDPTSATFDILYRFDDDTDAPRSLPSRDVLGSLKSAVGPEQVILDPARRAATLADARTRVSLRGMVRAAALDGAAKTMIERDVTSFVLNLAGDIYVHGRRADRPWRVGLQDPRAQGHFASFDAPAGAVVTVGDYQRFYFAAGARTHDVLDPKTGLPSTRCRMVVASAPLAVTAYALARAAFVAGARDGIALAARLRDVELVIVDRDNRVSVTQGIRGAVRFRPPTDAP